MCAHSKRRTPDDMLYEHMDLGESLPGIEEGVVLLPGVHNPGGLLPAGVGPASDSEGTKSEVCVQH